MTARGIVVATLALTGAFLAGRATSAPASASPEPARIAPRVPPRTIIERSATTDLEALRQVIREELARRDAAAPPPAEAADPADPAEPEAAQPAHPDALALARAVLEAGMADGHWTDDDRGKLRAAVIGLSQRETSELFDKLVRALNAGQLAPDVHGPPI